MEEFKYSKFYKIIYKYGNLPVSFVLIFYFLLSLININNGLGQVFAALISGLMLFILNKRYIENYKILPFKIETDDKKLICSDFFVKDKKIEIYFEDIEEIKGGIFDKKYSGIIKIYDGKQKTWIGFYNRINNSKMLYTILLSRIKLSLYEKVITNLGFKKDQFGKYNLKDSKMDRNEKKDKRK